MEEIASEPAQSVGQIRLRAHETGFIILGAGALAALVFAGHWRSAVSAEVCAGILAYSVAILLLARKTGLTSERMRLGVNYLFALWFYGTTSHVTAGLGSAPLDGALKTFDEFVFGTTPAVPLERVARPWLTDAMSACYLSYLVYLHGVLLWALWQPARVIQRLSALLFSGFAAGFLGYLLVPALGPGPAFPALFVQPLYGGMLTRSNDWIVFRGSAIYGIFPSLHLLITLLLLENDWRCCRSRFWLMLTPAAGLILSTLYLRYHYAADLLAGAALFLVLRAIVSRWNRSL